MYQIKVFKSDFTGNDSDCLESVVNKWLIDNSENIKEVVNISISTSTYTGGYTDKTICNYTVLYIPHGKK